MFTTNPLTKIGCMLLWVNAQFEELPFRDLQVLGLSLETVYGIKEAGIGMLLALVFYP